MATALHLHSAYSLLDGVSTPEQLAQRGAALGYTALALTDHNAVYGAIPFAQACQAHGTKPIIGAELTVSGLMAERPAHLTLLAMNEVGYGNLCRLITCVSAGQSEPSENGIHPDEVVLDAQHLDAHHLDLPVGRLPGGHEVRRAHARLVHQQLVFLVAGRVVLAQLNGDLELGLGLAQRGPHGFLVRCQAQQLEALRDLGQLLLNIPIN